VGTAPYGNKVNQDYLGEQLVWQACLTHVRHALQFCSLDHGLRVSRQ
jgi:hypothetical protein